MDLEDLGPDEELLVGAWLDLGGRVEGDCICDRISWLLSERLHRIATDRSGWFTLWRDERDGRLWELSYPRGELPGGGPPQLALLDRRAARLKYGEGAA
jgi:Immunity protein 27